MQLKQLAYFLAVTDYGSFSKAAEALYIAQSSLSQSVQALEQELGFSLLHRECGGVELTEMGEPVCRDRKELLTKAEGRNALRFFTVEGFCVPFVHAVAFSRRRVKTKELEVVLQKIQHVFSV